MDAEIRALMARLTPSELRELDALTVPPSQDEVLERLSAAELDRLEQALLARDTAAAEQLMAEAKRRADAGAPPWAETAEADRAHERARVLFWRELLRTALEQAAGGQIADAAYEALWAEARRRAEADVKSKPTT